MLFATDGRIYIYIYIKFARVERRKTRINSAVALSCRDSARAPRTATLEVPRRVYDPDEANFEYYKHMKATLKGGKRKKKKEREHRDCRAIDRAIRDNSPVGI